MPKDLVAIHAISHKPASKIVSVAPGEVFTPKNEEEREFLLNAKAARELSEAEAPAKKSTAKKAPASKKKPAAEPVAEPAPEKAVTLDAEQGESDATDMLD